MRGNFAQIARIRVGLLYLPDIFPSSGAYRATFPPRGKAFTDENSPGVFNTPGENFLNFYLDFFKNRPSSLSSILKISRRFSAQTAAVMATTGSAQCSMLNINQISPSTRARFKSSHAGWKSISNRPRVE